LTRPYGKICDYSLSSVKSVPAEVGQKLETRNFGTGTIGFTPAGSPIDERVACCVLPGTELAFDAPVELTLCVYAPPTRYKVHTQHTLARFRQINKDRVHTHHDALEFPDGGTTLLTAVAAGQRATVLQLPAQPKTEAEAQEQKRVEYAG